MYGIRIDVPRFLFSVVMTNQEPSWGVEDLTPQRHMCLYPPRNLALSDPRIGRELCWTAQGHQTDDLVVSCTADRVSITRHHEETLLSESSKSGATGSICTISKNVRLPYHPQK